MFFLGTAIFASLATAFNACIPVMFFCSQTINEEEIARFADYGTQYRVVT